MNLATPISSLAPLSGGLWYQLLAQTVVKNQSNRVNEWQVGRHSFTTKMKNNNKKEHKWVVYVVQFSYVCGA